MNKIFKVIWNPATGSYTVASETAKSRGKKSGRSKLLISALVAGGMLSSFGVQAQAGRDNGQGVNYGQGTGTGWVAIGEDAKANSFTDTGGGSSTAVGYHSTAEVVLIPNATDASPSEWVLAPRAVDHLPSAVE
ncbi:hypothetical protein AWF13_19950 [Escherichia coli]|nr:hypothetical protein AWF13_19950 [Escherichia coli]KUW11956.1 hypothetical protein AWF55_06335 [Escherichia coli]